MHTYQWNNRFVQTGGQAPDVFWLYTQFVFFWSAFTLLVRIGHCSSILLG